MFNALTSQNHNMNLDILNSMFCLKVSSNNEYNPSGDIAKRIADKLKKQVRCIETGQIFESQNAVAEFLGQKSASNISNCLSGKQKTCGGYHWERVGDEE